MQAALLIRLLVAVTLVHNIPRPLVVQHPLAEGLWPTHMGFSEQYFHMLLDMHTVSGHSRNALPDGIAHPLVSLRVVDMSPLLQHPHRDDISSVGNIYHHTGAPPEHNVHTVSETDRVGIVAPPSPLVRDERSYPLHR